MNVFADITVSLSQQPQFVEQSLGTPVSFYGDEMLVDVAFGNLTNT